MTERQRRRDRDRETHIKMKPILKKNKTIGWDVRALIPATHFPTPVI